jgi:hypothetical protein
MSFDRELHGVFSPSLGFGANPQDHDRAFEWLVSLRKRAIGWKEARAQIIEFLETQTNLSDHIERQVSKAELMLRPWLLD